MISIAEQAKRFSVSHRVKDPNTVLIMWSPHGTKVHLIEVTKSVGTTDEVIPFYFCPRPDLDLPHPTTIIILSLEEWEKIKNDQLKLPDGWENLQEL